MQCDIRGGAVMKKLYSSVYIPGKYVIHIPTPYNIPKSGFSILKNRRHTLIKVHIFFFLQQSYELVVVVTTSW